MTRRHDAALFLSLRAEFAELILDGVKKVELRRIRPRAVPGTHALVSATSPVKAVLGGCTVRSVITADPDEVWELHGVGITRPGPISPLSSYAWRTTLEYCAMWVPASSSSSSCKYS